MRFSARIRIAKNKHAVDTAIILFAQCPLDLCYFSSPVVIEHSALMALVFYNKGILEEVTMQRTQQFSQFSKSKELS